MRTQLTLTITFLLSFFTSGHNTKVDLTLTLLTDSSHQTIKHFGSSAAFNLNEVTEDWQKKNLDRLADFIFSRMYGPTGKPKGIGLSSFRIELGAGSRDQGDSSRVARVNARTECPLRPNGSYDWSKMEAETYWVNKCYEYGVSRVIAYSNSPPYYFTKNGLTCRTEDVPSANLRDDCYDDYAEYLAQIALYYAKRWTPIHYISPVNEPQWEWLCDRQEGTLWHNSEIKKLAIEIDKALKRHALKTRFIITEGGSIDRVYGFMSDPHGGQLRFWNPSHALYIGNLRTLAPYVAAHSYWTEDTNKRLVETRSSMFKEIKKIDPSLEWWQTEYSFLGNGFKDGLENPKEIDHGLFLAKVIHHDLTVGGASCWQYWETFSPSTGLPRYKLVTINHTDESYTPNTTAWALGHYSFFIRPGANRIPIKRSDNTTPMQAVKGIMPSAFVHREKGDLVVVIINYTNSESSIALKEANFIPDTTRLYPFITTASASMAPLNALRFTDTITIPKRSILTLFGQNITELVAIKRKPLKANISNHIISKCGQQHISIQTSAPLKEIQIYSLLGKRVWHGYPNATKVMVSTEHFPAGLYTLHLESQHQLITQKLLIMQ